MTDDQNEDGPRGPLSSPQTAETASLVAEGTKGGPARLCQHCGREMRGYASDPNGWLCHPDEGMDCYRLVTVYGHRIPCATLEADFRYFEALDDFIAEIESQP